MCEGPGRRRGEGERDGMGEKGRVRRGQQRGGGRCVHDVKIEEGNTPRAQEPEYGSV